MTLYNALLVAALPLLLLLSGCGPAAEVRPDLFPAEGTLLINGAPAAGARIFLQPADGGAIDERGTRPTAKVEEDGRYRLTTYQNGDGAPPGAYQLGIIWMNNETSSSAWDRLGGKFANPLTSKLTVVVNDGANQFDPIKLDGVRLRTHRPPNPRGTNDPEE